MSEQNVEFSPGLAGVIAGESSICWVDPNSGLRYRGYDVDDLARDSSFEEIAWLLLQGEMPSDAQLKTFRNQLAADRELPPAVIKILHDYPKDARAMDVLRTGTSLLSSFDPDIGKLDHDANVRKSIRLLARMTTLVTASWRIMHGHQPVDKGEDLTLAGRFLFSLTGHAPKPWQIKALNIMLILYAEHEFNASTFAARVTASTLADIYSAVVSAIGTLEGPLHGGANEEAMKMLRDIGSAGNAEAWVKERLAKREKIMGFGHRVYRTGDSRVPITRRVLGEVAAERGQPHWLEVCMKLEEVMQKEKGLFANLDLYAAPILYLLEIPAALNTPIFACSRVTGWCAHVIEQQDHNRLIRPRCLYRGPEPRSLPR